MRAGSNGSSTTAGSGSAVYLAGGAASSAQQLVQVQTNGSTNGGQVRPVSGAVILLLLEFFKFEINVHRYSQHSEKLSTSFSLKVSLTGGITYQLLGIGGLIVLNRF